MADAYLKSVLKRLNIDNVEVFSCGISAEDGECATAYAKEVVASFGASLEKHRATNIQKVDLTSFDKILVMTKEHKRRVCEISPKVSEKVELLKEYMTDNASGYMNIDDPWGLSLGVYMACATEIVNCVDNLAVRLLKKGG